MSPDTDLSNLRAVLALLADGKVRSGTDLAAHLGVSRAAVWKKMTKLSELGFEIQRSRAMGYRLKQPVELLDHSVITEDLAVRLPGMVPEVEVVFQVDSTNRVLLSRARRNRSRNLAFLLAEQQLHGRGRRGRIWHSPACRNVYLSAHWPTDRGLPGLDGLSLAIGVMVAKVLREEFSLPAMLKWPNDILVDGSKLGGILIEVDGDLSGPLSVIIGVGVNVDMSVEQRLAISQQSTDITAHARFAVSRNTIAGAIITALTNGLKDFEQCGFACFLSSWRDLDSFLDRPVLVQSGEEHWHGLARGVDERGALLLETREGMRSVISGEVSMRAVS